MAVAVTQNTTRLVRVRFPLARETVHYPPASEETLWSEELGEGRYRVDNIPFFVRGIAVDDVVEATSGDEMPTFLRLLQPSGHSTMRVIVYDAEEVAKVREEFHLLGCATESMSNSRLIAIDVPPSADLARVRSQLERGHAEERWDYEEAAVATE
ncbi:MAG TPA: DUF4265 domain-containing protein [Candidatus Limnocylindria bacterium]|nr:DUF4265 domain-containing protein [Candidatus Limnocylindria bacterium]